MRLFQLISLLWLVGGSAQLAQGSCSDQGREFGDGSAVPSLDCNSCSCGCSGGFLGFFASCHVTCTSMACDEPALEVGKTTVFDTDGKSMPFAGIKCAEPKACEVDGGYLRACYTSGGRLVDNGCCDFMCSAQVVRRAAVEPDEEACGAALRRLDEMWTDLDSTKMNVGDKVVAMHPARYPCKVAADCLLAPRHAIWGCALPLPINLIEFQKVKAELDQHYVVARKACPRFDAATCPKAGHAACVEGSCAVAP